MYQINFLDSLGGHHNKKQHIVFDGPSGLLEGVIYNINQTNSSNLALILPPDPAHKGTMNNKIVNLLFNVFEKLGFNTLKINYRGVGLSKGILKNKDDQISDALFALDWLIKECESSKIKSHKIFVAGFSLGGWIALQCSMRRPEVSNFITINSNFNSSDFNMLTPCPNGLILQSNNDLLTNVESSEKFSSLLINQKGCHIDFKILNDDHYISHSKNVLSEYIEKYIKEMQVREKLKKI